jgi:hypothetical protein
MLCRLFDPRSANSGTNNVVGLDCANLFPQILGEKIVGACVIKEGTITSIS